MSYKLKYLIFLSAFLIGAFSIITWKAFRVYSESYSEATLHSEMEILEEQVQNIAAEFEHFKTLANGKEDVEMKMKALQLPLMAHVVFAEGKWKAKWYEGVLGMREQAKLLAGQVAFESAPQSRTSWAIVRFQDRSSGYAFIMPMLTPSAVHFFAFFLDQKSMTAILKKNSIVESLHIFSAQAGEIYSTQPKDLRLIERQIKALSGKNQGQLSISEGNRLALYRYHPFLQAYVFKVISQIKVSSLPISRFYGLMLFAFILCGLAVYAMHILFDSLFLRLQTSIHKIKQDLGIENILNSADELTAIEHLADLILEKKLSVVDPLKSVPTILNKEESAPKEAMESPNEMANKIRSRVINCLGYLNRLKSQMPSESSHLRLLEQELRDMRQVIDAKAEIQPASIPQPIFNPILSSYQKELGVTKAEVRMSSDKKENLKSTTEVVNTIRRPKRELNDFGDL